MESNIKKVTYILLAFTLVIISNFLVIKPLLAKKDNESLIPTSLTELTVIEKVVAVQKNLYSKITLKKDDLNEKSQEWYQVNLRSDTIIKFQYANKKNDVSKLNIKVNDIVIENDEEFYEYDKYKINFHLYGDTLVIEHERSYDHVPYVKIIDLSTETMRNLPSLEDFYINDVIIDEYGVTAELSRLTSKLNYYIEKNETFLTFRVKNNNVSLNICNKSTWPDELVNLDYVYFDINYVYQDDSIDFDNPDITNFKKLDEFIKNYQQDFNNICKNNN